MSPVQFAPLQLAALPPNTLQPPIGPTVGDLLGSGADAAIAAVSHAVTTAALWLLDQVGHILAVTTRPELGSGWFTQHFKVMVSVAALAVLPLLMAGAIQAIARQDPSMLVRSFLVHLPLAVILTAAAVQLVQLSLAAVDQMSSMVGSATGVDLRHFMEGVGLGLQHPAGSGGLAPVFVLLVVAALVALGAALVWIELLVRTAVISVAVLFLPLALVTLVWPATASWCRRLAETIAALILAKLVMVGVLSLAVGALTGGAGTRPDVAGVLAGATMLVLAATSPFALLRVIPIVEAGAVAHLEGVGRRGAASFPAAAGAVASVLGAGGAGEAGAQFGEAGSGVGVAPGEPEPADIGTWVRAQAGAVDAAAPGGEAPDGPGSAVGAEAGGGPGVASGGDLPDGDLGVGGASDGPNGQSGGSPGDLGGAPGGAAPETLGASGLRQSDEMGPGWAGPAVENGSSPALLIGSGAELGSVGSDLDYEGGRSWPPAGTEPPGDAGAPGLPAGRQDTGLGGLPPGSVDLGATQAQRAEPDGLGETGRGVDW